MLSEEGQLLWDRFGNAVEEVGLISALTSLSAEFEALSSADRKIIRELNTKLFPPEGASNDAMIEDLIENFSKPARV